MPFRIKFTLSAIVLAVAVAAWWFQGSLGHVGPQYATLFLGVFMVVAMWVFPEVARKETGGGIRKD
jgi:hypothetical protein